MRSTARLAATLAFGALTGCEGLVGLGGYQFGGGGGGGGAGSTSTSTSTTSTTTSGTTSSSSSSPQTFVPSSPSCQGTLDCFGTSCCESVVVPGGTVPMGRSLTGPDACPSGMTCRTEDLPEHTVTVSTFALDRFEVTVGRLRRLLARFADHEVAA